MAGPDSSVFHDPDGRRWRRVKRTWFVMAIIVTALAVIFILSVLANPVLPSFKLRQFVSLPHKEDLKPKRPNLPANPGEQGAKKSKAELQKALAATKRIVPGKRRSQIPIVSAPPTLPTPVVPSSRPLSVGFYTNWDDSSYESLKRNLDHLDWVVPQWIHLQEDPGIANPIVTGIDAPALNWIRETRPQARILPMVQNLLNEKFDGQLLARAISDEQHRRTLIDALASFVQENRFAGVCVDFEEVSDAAQPDLLVFVKELHDRCLQSGLLVIQSVPFVDPAWNYSAYAAATDYLVLMAYDQHWARSDAGPVAAQDWFEQNLLARMKDLNPSKTIVALGNYGYDWSDARQEAKELTFQEALVTARESEAKPSFDRASRTLSFEYDEDDGSHHTVAGT